jgi:hypothetical protein
VGQPSADAFLALYPPPMRDIAESLRVLVKRAVPNSMERVRVGWRLIGYDVPVGRRAKYFAYVAPEDEHVHLGFEYGTLLDDPAGLLQGEHLQLRKVRYLTFRAGDDIPRPQVIVLLRQAARVAAMSRAEQSSLALTRDLGRPSSGPE